MVHQYIRRITRASLPCWSPFNGREIKAPKYLVVHHTALTDAVQLGKINEQHRREGYKRSAYGYNIAYHFFIGSDGTLVQTRDLWDRTPHTRNPEVAIESIAIVFAGNFNEQKPSPAQMDTFRGLYRELYQQFDIEHTIGHNHASPTACPGKYLLEEMELIFNPDKRLQLFSVSRYYTPVRGQSVYYRDTYEQDFKVNCHGDCFTTAWGYKLKPSDALKVVACPPKYELGTKFWIDGYGELLCVDRGGAIKGNRIDVWAGIAEEGLVNIRDSQGGTLYGRVIQ